jgi:hypothetical protein
MKVDLPATAIVIFAVSLWAGARERRHTPLEPSYTFRLLDEKLTLLSQHQTNLTHGSPKSQIVAARSMKRTAASIERTALRLQILYRRRHERFGAQMFRLLRLRAIAVQRSANSLEFTSHGQARETELNLLNARVLALVTQYQAAAGGYSALRCEPSEWSCCSPKREQDLRPGESMACRWVCVPTARTCTGFRGPRMGLK